MKKMSSKKRLVRHSKKIKKLVRKNKKQVLVLALIGIFLSSLLVVIHIMPAKPMSIEPAVLPQKIEKRSVRFGAWTEGFFDGSAKTLHTQKLLEFEKLVHKKVSIAHYYIGWESLADSHLITQFETIRANEWQPMLNVNPYFFNGCPPSTLTLYKALAEGKCDTFLHNAGKNLSHVQEPFYLVFAWEMNNNQNQWSIPYTGSSPADFILAWRHIHDIFKEEGAVNIIWVFCPNVPEDNLVAYKDIYPGDAYVDWIGLDGYNWGTTQSWSTWVDFAGVFTGSYNKLTAIAPNKPLMLAEVNTTDKGGNKGKWYIDMFTKQIPDNFPKIEAVIIFNEDKTKTEHVNWKIDVTKDSLQGFRRGVGIDLYK